MATYTGWFYRDNQPTQEIQFEASADLRNDKEELEQIMRAELRKRFSKSENLTIEDISIEFDEEAMLDQIIDTVKNLDRYKDYEAVVDEDGTIHFYDEETEIFVSSEALQEAIDYMLQNGTEEAEIRYDGLKYFTVSAIY
jgi:hypothetical protein